MDSDFVAVSNTTNPWYHRVTPEGTLDVLVIEGDPVPIPNEKVWISHKPGQGAHYFLGEHQVQLENVYISGPIDVDCDANRCPDFHVELINRAGLNLHSDRSTVYLDVSNGSKLSLIGTVDDYHVTRLDESSDLILDCQYKQSKALNNVVITPNFIAFDVYS
jgi:hypothetical protein